MLRVDCTTAHCGRRATKVIDTPHWDPYHLVQPREPWCVCEICAADWNAYWEEVGNHRLTPADW